MKNAYLLILMAMMSFASRGDIVVAFTPLQTDGEFLKERELISDILQAELSVQQGIRVVDRERMDVALQELQLGQQGMLTEESGRQLGRMVGAGYYCTGSLRKRGEGSLVMVRVIDVETSVVKLAYEEIGGEMDALDAGRALAGKLHQLLLNIEAEMDEAQTVAESKQEVPRIPENWKRPSVMVVLPEMHVNQPVIDPAAEVELIKRLLDENFVVLDSVFVDMTMKSPEQAETLFGSPKTSREYAANEGADILMYGEAFSERGAQIGSFVGCRARVELKIIDTATGVILLADSAYGGATDLAESTAGKKALQLAVNRLADTMLYALAELWNQK